MILPGHELMQWALRGGLAPFDPACINPASVDLRISTEHIVGLAGWERGGAVVCEFLPGDPVLLSTVEFVRMPGDCAGVLYLKSSMARQGLDCASAGFVDPGFCGELTVKFYAHRPVAIEDRQRVVQLVLYRMEGDPEELYHGKYLGQRGPTGAR